MGNQGLIILCYTIVIIMGLFLFRPKKEEKTTVPVNDYQTIMAILQNTVEREIQHQHNLIYKVRDVKIIYNFQDDLTALVKEVMSSFSPLFLNELEYYHSRQYVLKFVTRFVEVYLIEYTQQNKPKTK